MKTYRPTTSSRRFMTTTDFSMLSKKTKKQKIMKSLLGSMTRKTGRMKSGKISTQHRGGGSKKRFRIIEFKQSLLDNSAKVRSIEYDPNRTAFIAHIVFTNGIHGYILAPDGLKVDDKIIFSKDKVEMNPGNRTMLKNIPEGILVHNIELRPGSGGQFARSAGSSAKVVTHEKLMTQIQLPSGEIRFIFSNCFASIGQLSNIDHSNVEIGKAGRKRWMGRRPAVRGKAKNPNDHPHGGGEGNQSIGLIHPKTPWGMPALGKKTRNKTKQSSRYILKPRKK